MQVPDEPIAQRSVPRYNVQIKSKVCPRLVIRTEADGDPSKRDDHRASVRDRNQAALKRADGGRNRKLYHQIMAGEA